MATRNDDSWLALALQSGWPVSACIALVLLALEFLVAPVVADDNPIVTSMSPVSRPYVLLAAALFGLVAAIKWAVSHRRGPPADRPRSAKGQPAKPAPAPVRGWSLELIQSIEWKRFEDLCQKFYEIKGVRSAGASLGPDGGFSIRLFQDGSEQASAIIKCNARNDSFVGERPVRTLADVMTHEKVGKAFFITSGKFSEEAEAFAASNRITLIDGESLLSMLKRLPGGARLILLKIATAGAYRIPSCPACGKKMWPITGKGTKPYFWGCPSYPSCRHTLWVRHGTSSLPIAIVQ